jgi:hypothetical protein
MTINDLLVDALERNLGMVNMTLADFSDADMLVRPCSGANHAAWQLGHLVAAEKNLCAAFKPDAHPEFPAGFKEKFSKQTTTIDDPNFFPKKEELLTQFARMRQATIAWARAITSKELEQPTPEQLKRLAPNAAGMLAMIPTHVAMHIGQIQGIRRKLGKPVLF